MGSAKKLKHRLAVRSKVWFDVGGKRVFGSGLAQILELVRDRGTLRAAARAAGISYRHAWDLLRDAEKRSGRRLFAPHAGGPRGGRSEITPEGRRLLDIYRRVNREVAAYADKRFAFHNRVRGGNHGS
jgi:molybdate transport system regulatory protein